MDSSDLEAVEEAKKGIAIQRVSRSFAARQKCLMMTDWAFAHFVSCSIQGLDSMLRSEGRS